MFINQNVLYKQMKENYKKSKLILGNLVGGLVIHTDNFTVWMHHSYVPNKIKGLIVELAGKLPSQDTEHIYRISKSEPEPITIHDDEIINHVRGLITSCGDAEHEVVITPLTLYGNQRIVKSNADIIGMYEDVLCMIDKGELDLNIESEPDGPYNHGGPKSEIIWINDICKVLMYPLTLKETALITQLQTQLAKIDFVGKEVS